jgi:putative ABC transport system permease protein
MNPDGTINLDLTPDVWSVSAILVQSRGGVTMQSLLYYLNNGTDVMACNPATEMRAFFDTFLQPMKTMLLMICSLVIVVAAIGILVSIYNSISGRMREIAILRALGATRQTILGLICAEAGLVGLVGGVLGIVIGHGLSGVGSVLMAQKFGQGINWVRPDGSECVYLIVVVLLAVLAGLAPALKAYRTPVATHLVAE